MTDELQEPIPIRTGLPRARTTRPKRKAEGEPTAEEEALALARRIVDLASDKKASDIVLLEVGG